MQEQIDYWRLAVLVAIREHLEDDGEENPVSAWSIHRRFDEWGLREFRDDISIVMLSLRLVYFHKVETPYASARFVWKEPSNATATANSIESLFDFMAYDSGLETLWEAYHKYGFDWLKESLENIGSIDGLIPESSTDGAASRPKYDGWEPLAVEYDSEHADEVINAIEAATDAIESDNGYASEHHAERNSIVNSLRSAVSYMRVRGDYTRIYFQHSVVLPLQKAVARLGGNVAGKSAEAALKGVQKWITENVFDLLNRL